MRAQISAITRCFSALIIIPSLACTAFAQESIAELSAKERIRIAEKEKTEAAQDVSFQNLMNEGHNLFEGKHYLKAIHAYEKAAEERPFNVYPKVIIADIELSMKDTLEILRAAEKAEEEEIKKQEIPESPKPDLEPEDKKEDNSIERLDNWEEKERERLAKEREARERMKEENPPVKTIQGDVEALTIDDFREELGEKYPSGITETITKEGNKTITKRIIVKEGSGDEYKKVVHDWGGVFYFKNGDAVTERVWKQEASK